MPDLQMQAMNIINQMSEEELKVLVKFMRVFIQPQISADIQSSEKASSKRIGIAEGECLCDPEDDIDEYNEEIAKMFGVV
jgi:hypothetical protein